MKNKLRSGFTLIELMIVVAIIAIIAAVALPNYQDYIKSTRRGAAASCMLEMAQQMERRYTSNFTYFGINAPPAVACTTGVTDYYTFTFASNEPTTSTFVILATPQGGQVDACGILTLNQRSVKGADSGGGDAALIKKCWK